jgi:hypothetical protein
MSCSPHAAFMRLLYLWQQNCCDDPNYQLHHRLEDIVNEANILAVAQRDLFAEYDPERRLCRFHVVKAWLSDPVPVLQ